MPNASAYASRKAAGRCGLCGAAPRPASVLCDACARRQQDYRARQRTPEAQRAYLLRKRRRDTGLRLVPQPVVAPAAHLLLCCGQWWTITHIPLVVSCCGRRWLVQEHTP